MHAGPTRHRPREHGGVKSPAAEDLHPGYTWSVAAESLAGQMRTAALALLRELDGPQQALAAHSFTDVAARRWLEYRPERRPGACLADLTGPARKAAHRLLATGTSDHAFAQAMAIVALEEVLDRRERGQRNRHGNDYWVNVFGDPAGDGPWAWRFEGHHLSVSMTALGDEVSPAPVFLGANPARISYAGLPVSRPLAPEEDIARALLDALGPAGRAAAVVSGSAPSDIRTATSPSAPPGIEPLGIAAARLGPAARILAGELHFAWEGAVTPGARHYYRVQGDDLLIEYDNAQDDGNHAHTVLRRPRSDFGDDVLARHLRESHV
jgi:hypothetical protein